MPAVRDGAHRPRRDAAAAQAAALGMADPSAAPSRNVARRGKCLPRLSARGTAKLSRVEQIKRFLIVGTPWEPGGDELTPTMKLKRRPIAEKYSAEIDKLYAETPGPDVINLSDPDRRRTWIAALSASGGLGNGAGSAAPRLTEARSRAQAYPTKYRLDAGIEHIGSRPPQSRPTRPSVTSGAVAPIPCRRCCGHSPEPAASTRGPGAPTWIVSPASFRWHGPPSRSRRMHSATKSCWPDFVSSGRSLSATDTFERVNREVSEALKFYGHKGWLEQPEDSSRRPRR